MDAAAKNALKLKLESYLIGRGINPAKNFRCLNPDHEDRNPSMSFDRARSRAHCFGCGADYDIFDVIGLEHGIYDPAERFRYAAEILGGGLSRPMGARAAGTQPGSGSQLRRERVTDRPQKPPKAPQADFTAYYDETHAAAGQTPYFGQRGLSDAVIGRFRLGYDAAKQLAIIPVTPDFYVARSVNPEARLKYVNPKGCASRLFNAHYLQEAEPVFVVEGAFDALALETLDFRALALNSVANAAQLTRLLEETPPRCPLVLALDNDEAGRKARAKLAGELTRLNLRFVEADLAGACKDANEALLQDAAGLKARLLEADIKAREVLADGDAAARSYVADNAAAYVGAFLDAVENHWQDANRREVLTGFDNLDEALGGIYDGRLISLGAISSLGKTSFILQMADQIAAQGFDVLYFTLEMSRFELVARSLSRLSFQLERPGGARPLSAFQLGNGKNWERHGDVQRAFIYHCADRYAELTPTLYFNEGLKENFQPFSVLDVEEAVARHVALTGRKPVIFIDYLQIMAPTLERGTDKQNIDMAVLALKKISRRYDMPVFAVSSFSRSYYRQSVTMEAFKESGAIEYSSDIILGMQPHMTADQDGKFKDFDIDRFKSQDVREIELKVLKNRNGVTGQTLFFNYTPAYNVFEPDFTKRKL